MLNNVTHLSDKSPQELLTLCMNGDSAACQQLEFGKPPQIAKYAHGGDVENLLAPQEMMMGGMEDEGMVPQVDASFAPLLEILGPEKAEELTIAIEAFPVVAEVAEMATKTSEGQVDGMGTGVSDEVPARLSAGEFVFSAEAVAAIGLEKLEALHEEAKRQASSL